MNLVELLGRYTKDPEVRYSGDLAIARNTIAVADGKDKTNFINTVAFGKNAEFEEKYCKKGMLIAVSGKIQTGSYEKDGKKVYTFEVVVANHYFCDKKPENTTNFEENLPFN